MQYCTAFINHVDQFFSRQVPILDILRPDYFSCFRIFYLSGRLWIKVRINSLDITQYETSLPISLEIIADTLIFLSM